MISATAASSPTLALSCGSSALTCSIGWPLIDSGDVQAEIEGEYGVTFLAAQAHHGRTEAISPTNRSRGSRSSRRRTARRTPRPGRGRTALPAGAARGGAARGSAATSPPSRALRPRCAGCAGPPDGGPWGARPALVVPVRAHERGRCADEPPGGGRSMGKDRLDTDIAGERRHGGRRRWDLCGQEVPLSRPRARRQLGTAERLEQQLQLRGPISGGRPRDRPDDRKQPRAQLPQRWHVRQPAPAAGHLKVDAHSLRRPPLARLEGEVGHAHDAAGRRGLGRSGPSPHWDGRRR